MQFQVIMEHFIHSWGVDPRLMRDLPAILSQSGFSAISPLSIHTLVPTPIFPTLLGGLFSLLLWLPGSNTGGWFVWDIREGWVRLGNGAKVLGLTNGQLVTWSASWHTGALTCLDMGRAEKISKRLWYNLICPGWSWKGGSKKKTSRAFFLMGV